MMFKTLFFTLALGLPLLGHTRVDVRWLSVASMVIDDGKTRILLDPTYTRPGLMHWLNLEPFKSDVLLVEKVLKDNELLQLNAVFSSHSHFDHVVDAPAVARITGATFYVDESSSKIVKAYKDPSMKQFMIKDEVPLLIGDFTVIPIKTPHSKFLGIFSFLPGPVADDFDFGFYDYREGETWSYVIIHPEQTIFFASGPEALPEKVGRHTTKVDVLIQSIAGRTGNDQIIGGYLKAFAPKIFIPNHFDNFFKAFAPEDDSLFPGIRLDGLLDEIKKARPTMKVVRPVYGQRIELPTN